MTINEALDRINEMLYIDAARTVRGDEIKIWTHNPEEGGRSKDYLNRSDLDRLIECLTVVRDGLS
jgi:hypothetical protein